METLALIFAPHPDDAEIAMGGTIARLIKAGLKVVLVDLTNGEPTPFGDPIIRAEETKEASKILGLTERKCLGLKNRELFDTVENRKLVAEEIRRYKPSLLFIPYWEDAHPDHVEACKLCESARFYAKFHKTDMSGEPHYPKKVFHFFSTHLKVKINPSFVFDISETLNEKMRAIRAYESQFLKTEKGKARVEEIELEAKFWGGQVGAQSGEPFACREYIKLANVNVFKDL